MNMNPATEAEQTFEQATPTGVAELDLIEMTAPVTKIDYANRIVTLTGPRGDVHVVRVDPSVPGLNAIKPGDKVVVGTDTRGRGEREAAIGPGLRVQDEVGLRMDAGDLDLKIGDAVAVDIDAENAASS